MIECLFLDTNDRRYFSAEARRVIMALSEQADGDIRALLPMLPPRVELVAQTGWRVIPETGAMGSATSRERVTWTVDPKPVGGVEAVARAHLRATLFHELHHVVRGWTYTGGIPTTRFIDGVISEGLATAFERDFGGGRPLWGEYPEEVALWVKELLALPRSASYNAWMFKHPDGRRWVGYKAGTFIADRAIAASQRTAAELVNASSAELLALAGFY